MGQNSPNNEPPSDSPITEKGEGEYPIQTEADLKYLLDNDMELTRAVPTGYAKNSTIYGDKVHITAEVIKNIVKFRKKSGITIIYARPIAAEVINEAVENVRKVFDVIDDILSKKEEDEEMEDVATRFQMNLQIQKLMDKTYKNIKRLQAMFNTHAADHLLALNRKSNSSARHSIMAAFNAMEILTAREEFDDETIVKGSFQTVKHDLGKQLVPSEILNFKGRPEGEDWKKMQDHVLHGGMILSKFKEGDELGFLIAVLHQEYYAKHKEKGYGGLTTDEYYEKIGNDTRIDIKKMVTELNPKDRDLIFASFLADMITALEEKRSYKPPMSPFKVLLIIFEDAKAGHFNPVDVEAWSEVYRKKHPYLLLEGQVESLPREFGKKHFVSSTWFSFKDLEKLGYLPEFEKKGIKIDICCLRGGMSFAELMRIKRIKKLDINMTPQYLKDNGIRLEKGKAHYIKLPVKEYILTYDELTGPMGYTDIFLKRMLALQISEIKNHGVGLAHFARRKYHIKKTFESRLEAAKKECEKATVNPEKTRFIHLPAQEDRLTMDELEEMGINASILRNIAKKKMVGSDWKDSLSVEELAKNGFEVSLEMMKEHCIDPRTPIYYDVEVVKTIGPTRARFVIRQEGDKKESVLDRKRIKELNGIQRFLIEDVGEVEMDFSELVALPDLSHVQMNPMWEGEWD